MQLSTNAVRLQSMCHCDMRSFHPEETPGLAQSTLPPTLELTLAQRVSYATPRAPNRVPVPTPNGEESATAPGMTRFAAHL